MASIDLFCAVVDNYGDIGVCWRLAQQLQSALAVRLYVDDLAAFARIEPLVNPELPEQVVKHIRICAWQQAEQHNPASLVIEAFACELPPAYVQRMGHTTELWLNVDYLSAEPWVEDLHLQPSVQANGVPKYFFFPGFTKKTGGLLHHTVINEPIHWDELGLAQAPVGPWAFVFSYPSAPLATLYQALAMQPETWTVLTAATVPPPTAAEQAMLPIHRLPYLSQRVFDRLLQQSDLNIVRGEDSFVGAIWAGRPFIWQPYEQEDQLHLEKLAAWLQTTPFDAATQQLMRNWNQGSLQASDLAKCLRQRQQWQQQCQHYIQQLQQQDGLAMQLLAFYSQMRQKRVK